MTLVADTWGANRNPTPKIFKMYKTLTATAVSGSAVTDTEAIFTKDCPFPVKVVGFEVQAVILTAGDFNGSGSAMTVALQTSDEVDISPAAPTSVVWDTAVTVNCSGITSDTDKKLFVAPANAGDRVDVGLDQTYVAIPKGGSMRATLSTQAKDAVSVSSTVELLTIVECIPTATKDKLRF